MTSMLERPTITALRLRTDDERTLHYNADPDLPVKLTRGGLFSGSTGPDTRFVLVTLDLDGEATDVVDVDDSLGRAGVETLDRAITALVAVRAGLLP